VPFGTGTRVLLLLVVLLHGVEHVVVSDLLPGAAEVHMTRRQLVLGLTILIWAVPLTAAADPIIFQQHSQLLGGAQIATHASSQQTPIFVDTDDIAASSEAIGSPFFLSETANAMALGASAAATSEISGFVSPSHIEAAGSVSSAISAVDDGDTLRIAAAEASIIVTFTLEQAYTFLVTGFIDPDEGSLVHPNSIIMWTPGVSSIPFFVFSPTSNSGLLLPGFYALSAHVTALRNACVSAPVGTGGGCIAIRP
jgi:hypothetical protein